eukprot:CAMPEP_0198138322 /NCGR_PEP_ID=MMETSP1443-20131203/1725_1 /TAXON_ID=186043 /ORGANISM="Entomoneis sp., Strain CCMP2396" /LENGTH=439 /DNA_ID=CAMNT_0043800041 /DNA_START=318 /DNA_END=1634 /DNA_ORIENTATION=+
MARTSVRKNQSESKGNTSPAVQCWMYGRYCCFRFGLYPLAVAPVLTAACLLSLYSTTGCKFVDVDLGFEPKPNEAWNVSSTSLGFYYGNMPGQQLDSGGNKFDPALLDKVHDECNWYPDAFENNYIDNDRTWKVARIMALISAGGSLLSAIMTWSFIGPFYCPVTFLWPAVLLPIVMMSFIAEGSKFLIFDMSICRNSIFEIEVDGVIEYQEADTCTLGDSAILGIVSAILLLVAMLMMCLNVPDERKLDPQFGITASNDTDESDGIEEFHEQRLIPTKNMHKHHDDIESRPRGRGREDASELSDDYFDDGLNSYMKHRAVPTALSSPMIERPKHPYDAELFVEDEEEEDKASAKSIGNSTLANSTLASSKVGIVGDNIKISESRLSTLASVEEKAAGSANSPTATNMLEELVQDLNDSYQQPGTSTGRTSPTSSRRSH